jgi:hypothetical protein
MSAAARAAGAKLRRQFANIFKVELALVECAETFPDECEVWCPTRPELPRWSTGEMK